ncbi:peptidoglycan editing factor PgeF [bacterium]|jgi:polyphenol oxidase|nr:peptidoglycan editing factor PgeF [bacterium]
MLSAHPELVVYFGDKGDQLINYDPKVVASQLFAKLDLLKQKFGVGRLVLLDQVHGTCAHVISKSETQKYFSKQGDILVTNVRDTALGIMTADCLPVMLYDPVRRVIAAVHAGWKGSISGVTTAAVKLLKSKFHSRAEDLKVFLGPCACVCCYEVSKDFMQVLESWKSIRIFVSPRRYFFNHPLYVTEKLVSEGILLESIKTNTNHCTICDSNFHSHRRSRGSPDRQISVIFLR